jgi:hypothetical protein
VTLRLPDFVIGGAPRSGTTWLTSALDLHPDIWIAKPLRPEPKFFLIDDLYAGGLESYSERWFAEAPERGAIGEKSTNYLESLAAAERIGRDLPQVKLVFMLREPADRALSNYRWSVMNGMEDQDFATALSLEGERERTLPAHLRYARPHAYFSRGLYARLLRPWLDRFPADQVLVRRFEDLVTDPGGTTAAVHRFLGVDERPELAGQPEGVNPSVADTDIDPETMSRLRRDYAPHNEELAELLGPTFLPWTYEELSA